MIKNTKKRHRNFVFTFHDPDLKGITPEELLRRSEKLNGLRFIIFQWEKTPKGEKSISHFQGYLEFENYKSFRVINEKLFDNQAHVDERRGSQKQAINYCTNNLPVEEMKELFLNEVFRWGKPRVDYSVWNRDNNEIPSNRDEQWVHLSKEIILRKYRSIEDIDQDYPYFVIHFRNKIQEMLDEANPVNPSRVSPAKTVWLYGQSGSGKSCLNGDILKEYGYEDKDATYLKFDRQQSNFFFDKSANRYKVMVCEEVRKGWPKKNSLINWVDRKDPLPVKGSFVRNNFELIIFNSTLSPEEVYSVLPFEEQIEPLRRIYSGKVLKVELNENLLIETNLKLLRKEIASDEFSLHYHPLVTDVSENYPECIRDLFQWKKRLKEIDNSLL